MMLKRQYVRSYMYFEKGNCIIELIDNVPI